MDDRYCRFCALCM